MGSAHPTFLINAALPALRDATRTLRLDVAIDYGPEIGLEFTLYLGPSSDFEARDSTKT